MKKNIIPYIAIFGAFSIIMSSIRVSFPLGNPNLGSTPISISAIFLNSYGVFMVGVIKGIGVSIWTGQALLELPAGIGDGIMGLFTHFLCKRIRISYAIILGQISRYIFTSGMIALTLGLLLSLSPNIVMPLVGKVIPNNLQTNLFSNILAIWFAMIPAITTSIIVNSILSVIIGFAIEKFYKNVNV
ncbi:MAG: hypothetical protein QXW62_05295 [Candidatus Methanomethylicaceae archaeon]|nr:hypothetical protein [Candidatus Verstraetearchaeota archaeon]